MNLSELQAELRHFAAERDWQPFHTPKNLSTALMVEAAELAEIFQWMTSEQSREASRDPEKRRRVADEIADVMLYLLQVADHCEIDIGQATTQKLARNAQKYPPARTIARVSPSNAASPGVHVLLDYENVQPTEDALRALVPDANQVWVFHGPQQRQVEQRFGSFGEAVTAVPISKTGKNALDFHLSFYMGYIASRNPSATLVIVANDKGYEPMLEHARAMGFAARRLGHGELKTTAAKTRPKSEVGTAAKKAAAKKAPATKVGAKKATLKAPPAPKAAAKKPAPARKTTAAKKASSTGMVSAPKALDKASATAPKATTPSPPISLAKTVKARQADAGTIQRLVDNLRKMGDKRPTKPKSLRRSLKSFLGTEATEDHIEDALGHLMDQGIVRVDSATGVSYPQFPTSTAATSAS